MSWKRSRDVWLAVGLAAFAFVPGSGIFGVALGDQDARDQNFDLLAALLILAQCLPLVLRRSRPGLALALVGTAVGAYQVLGYHPSAAGLSLYVALYSAGAHLARRRLETAGAFAVGYAVVAILLHQTDYHERPVDYLTFVPVLALCWLLGEGIRARAQSEAARRVAQEREAVVAERARIARELHDVVTHHVTAMVVQAEALPYLLPPETDRAREGLATISTTGRSAMTDLRELLNVLHDPAEPVVTPESLAELVERARSAGPSVEFAEHGDPVPLPTGLGLALQRVVQESLTNALKHAPGRPTTVTLTHTENAVDVEVVTAGGASNGGRPWARSGRGIAGMRDRVSAFGGELTAGREPDGSFAVRARLPR